jgi:hypothetical protein
MPLEFVRPTRVRTGVQKDRPDYIVYSGQWAVGRIYKTRGVRPEHAWFWSMYANGPMRRAGHAESLKEAKVRFQKCWNEWKAWTHLKEQT